MGFFGDVAIYVFAVLAIVALLLAGFFTMNYKLEVGLTCWIVVCIIIAYIYYRNSKDKKEKFDWFYGRPLEPTD